MILIAEINEAFAGQAVACVKDLGLDIERSMSMESVGIGIHLQNRN